MNRGRKVGVLTLGVTLIVFGILFIMKTIFANTSFLFILKLWPIILILFGCEILISYIINKEDTYKFDGASVAILIIMAFFSMMMASAEVILSNIDRYIVF